MQEAKVDFKSMPFKKRLEYIWDYYKLHIMGTLAVVFFVCSFIYGQVTKIQYDFNITIAVNSYFDENMSKFEDELTGLVVSPEVKRHEAEVALIPISGSAGTDAASSMQMMQKFSVQVAAGEIDLLIIDKVDVQEMSEQGLILNLDEVQNINVNDDLLVKTSNGYNYGIDISSSNKLKGLTIDSENAVLAVCASSKRLEKVPKVVQWFLD